MSSAPGPHCAVQRGLAVARTVVAELTLTGPANELVPAVVAAPLSR
jgi:hypothetical protein